MTLFWQVKKINRFSESQKIVIFINQEIGVGNDILQIGANFISCCPNSGKLCQSLEKHMINTVL